MSVETMRVLRLTTTTVDPISFILPRADHLKQFFMDDVYAPARSRAVSQEAAGWLSGANVAPALEELRPEGVTPLSEKPVEAPKASKAQVTRQQIAETAKEDKKNVDNFNRLVRHHHRHATSTAAMPLTESPPPLPHSKRWRCSDRSTKALGRKVPSRAWMRRHSRATMFPTRSGPTDPLLGRGRRFSPGSFFCEVTDRPGF